MIAPTAALSVQRKRSGGKMCTVQSIDVDIF